MGFFDVTFQLNNDDMGTMSMESSFAHEQPMNFDGVLGQFVGGTGPK